MPKKAGVNTDELIEALQDEKVMTLLITRLTPIVEEVFKKLASDFQASLTQLVEKMVGDQVKPALESTNMKMKELEDNNKILQRKLDELETHSRLDNLVFHGLVDSPAQEFHSLDGSSRPNPEQRNRASIGAVKSLCLTHLGLDLSETDISTAHRLPRRGMEQCPPIIVKFTTRNMRDTVFAARKLLRHSSVSGSEKLFINEHLTRVNSQIFAQARKMVRDKVFFATWTAGGYTYVRRTDGSGEKPKKIFSVTELEQLREL